MINAIFLICYFGTIFLLILYYQRISQILKLIDKPSKKKIHKKPTPLIGGVIIFFLLIEIFALQYSNYWKNLDIIILITICFLCFINIYAIPSLL